MGKRTKIALNKSITDEKGQAFIVVLILLLLGGLIIAPLLAYMSTGLKAGQVYEKKTDELYAADAGVEDARWQIEWGKLESLTSPTTYDVYDYTTVWTYDLDEPVNGKAVNVSVENVWIPKDLTAPSKTQAWDIIDAAKLIVMGSVPEAPTYRIEIIYYPEAGEELMIETLGIWLPPGFSYVAGTSTFSEPATEPYKGGQAMVWTFGVPFIGFPGVDEEDLPMKGTITFQFTPAEHVPEAVSWIDTNLDLTGGITYTWDADTKVYRIVSRADDTEVEAYTIKSEARELRQAISGDYFATGNALLTPTGSAYYRNRLYEESSATVTTGNIPADATIEVAFLYWSGWIDWAGYNPAEKGDLLFYDECTSFEPNWSLISPSDWHISSIYTAFYGHHDTGGNRELEMKNALDLSAYYEVETVTVSWRHWLYSHNIESDDCLQYAFYDGSQWGNWNTAFCNDTEVGTRPVSFSVDIPNEYLTNSFKMKFRIQNFGGGWERCYIDNVTIAASGAEGLRYPTNPTDENLRILVEETARVNKVMFSTTEENATVVTTDEWQIVASIDLPGEDTYEGRWSYNCFYNATDLVQQWIGDEDIATNGAGTYTLGHVVADNEEDPDFSVDLYPSGHTGYPLGTPAQKEGWYYPSRHHYCYAGWSLIIIYSSPEIRGHQLYLYDVQNPNFTFFEAWHSNPDFDGDGEDGGFITGFLAPESIIDEAYAAHITVFAAEGDEGLTGDYIQVNSVNLSNSVSPVGNVWNSQSPGLTIPGVDIDTFTVEYPTIEPGETQAFVDLPTGSDGFCIVYIILSFRSEVVAGGSIIYRIEG